VFASSFFHLLCNLCSLLLGASHFLCLLTLCRELSQHLTVRVLEGSEARERQERQERKERRERGKREARERQERGKREARERQEGMHTPQPRDAPTLPSLVSSPLPPAFSCMYMRKSVADVMKGGVGWGEGWGRESC
jgi:hypothetical protein